MGHIWKLFWGAERCDSERRSNTHTNEGFYSHCCTLSVIYQFKFSPWAHFCFIPHGTFRHHLKTSNFPSAANSTIYSPNKPILSLSFICWHQIMFITTANATSRLFQPSFITDYDQLWPNITITMVQMFLCSPLPQNCKITQNWNLLRTVQHYISKISTF